MTEESSRPQSIADMNVTPMIDVMFVLLVLFLVSIPLTLPQTLGVDLPKTARHTPLTHDEDTHRLALRADGTVLLNGEALTGGRLSARLSEIASSQDARVLLEADGSITYDQIARLMVDVQKAGVSGIGVVTEGVEK
jgi:biopolymer transport protein ExbD